MGVGNYSVPIDIVKHLSVRSIDAFRQLSVAWQRFLGVDGSTAKYVEPSRTTERPMRNTISSALVSLPKEKEVRVSDPQADAIHRGLQQVLGKQDVGFRSVEQEQALLCWRSRRRLLSCFRRVGARACFYTASLR
jgi:hypothetical protein